MFHVQTYRDIQKDAKLKLRFMTILSVCYHNDGIGHTAKQIK